ncbi:MAG: amidohydrolase family protein [Acidimicrobiales bacterium]
MKFDHPIIDTDGHLLEVIPHVAEYAREIGGAAVTDRLVAKHSQGYTPIGGNALAWWATPRDALDRATSFVPKLLHERLPELGIDFAIVYPTSGLAVLREPDAELRHVATRAFNSYYADHMRDLSDRITIPAAIPMDTPEEAIGHLEHAVNELGFKAALFASYVPRPTKDGVHYDVFGVDSAYDYDPVWQRCIDLGVAYTAHSGSQAIGFRSTTSYMYNHVGHFAESGHAIAKALLLGGVTRRFPKLNFAFLEGGAAYAVIMLADVIARFEKRGGANIHNLDPARLDTETFYALLEQYGGARYATDEVRRSTSALQDTHPENLDEFWRMEAKSAEDIIDLFVSHFYFGCEADDPTNAWAFNPNNPHGVRLRAVLGSDIGHWDVPDFREVLPEAYELVEHGLLTDDDFREFACDNAIRLHGGMNPRFFDGTAVEAYAREFLRSN